MLDTRNLQYDLLKQFRKLEKNYYPSTIIQAVKDALEQYDKETKQQ